MLFKLLAAIAVVAIILLSSKGRLQELKRKIDKRAESLGMEPIFGTKKQ